MKNTISTKKVPNLTMNEIVQYTLLFCFNWTEDDFKIAFKNSHLGWKYFWNKLQSRIDRKSDDPKNPTSAIVGIILNMDDAHREMLYDYIFNSDYSTIIIKQREMDKMFDVALDNNNKNN